jgi:hypothetical protein
MNKKFQTLRITGACVTLLLLLACGQITPGTTVTDIPTPTPTIGAGALMPSDDATEPPSLPTSGEIEMHTHDMVGNGEDCISNFPFTINWEADPPITGKGSVDCHFQSPGTPTHHAVMKSTVTLQGSFTTGDLGEKRVLIDLTFDGSLSQYDTGVPEGAINPFPESNPAVIIDKGPYPTLNFELLDGAKVIMLLGKSERIFFLRLME